MKSTITGIILAGGKSSRIGRDKSFLLFNGKPLIEVIIDTISPLFKDLLIIANSPRQYEQYGIKIVGDKIKGCGPLGGVYTGLLSSDTQYNFFCACDMPFLEQKLIKFLLQDIEKYDSVVPYYQNRYHPLCAVYSKSCIGSIETELRQQNFRITSLLEKITRKTISEDIIKLYDSRGLSFVNINTLNEYNSFKFYHSEKITAAVP